MTMCGMDKITQHTEQHSSINGYVQYLIATRMQWKTTVITQRINTYELVLDVGYTTSLLDIR
jgi:hypothetical protein